MLIDAPYTAITGSIIDAAIEGRLLDAHYRADLIVEGDVIVEVKSVETLLPVHRAQVLTYLKLARCPAALLINFNVPRLVDGVRRLLNDART